MIVGARFRHKDENIIYIITSIERLFLKIKWVHPRSRGYIHTTSIKKDTAKYLFKTGQWIYIKRGNNPLKRII